MIIRKKGGMTEFIPSPPEKREALVRDYSPQLLENLHRRICLIEEALSLPQERSRQFARILARMKAEEASNLAFHADPGTTSHL